MKPKTKQGKQKRIVPTIVTEYRPTELERATDANYESAARIYVQLMGADPDEVVQVKQTTGLLKGGMAITLKMERWKLAVRELQPWDMKLIALQSTQIDRIPKGVETPA